MTQSKQCYNCFLKNSFFVKNKIVSDHGSACSSLLVCGTVVNIKDELITQFLMIYHSDFQLSDFV